MTGRVDEGWYLDEGLLTRFTIGGADKQLSSGRSQTGGEKSTVLSIAHCQEYAYCTLIKDYLHPYSTLPHLTIVYLTTENNALTAEHIATHPFYKCG